MAIHATPHSWRASLPHYALHALVIASASLLLDHAGALAWLDATTLRVAASLADDEPRGDEAPSEADAARDLPVIVSIADTLWETEFRQESPLSRATLQKILAPIASSRPK